MCKHFSSEHFCQNEGDLNVDTSFEIIDNLERRNKAWNSIFSLNVFYALKPSAVRWIVALATFHKDIERITGRCCKHQCTGKGRVVPMPGVLRIHDKCLLDE